VRLKEGYSCKEGRKGHSLRCRGCPGQTFARRLAANSGNGRAYIQMGRGPRFGGAFVVVEVVACRRVSQGSDIRQCSSESRSEIEIEAGHH